MYSSTYDLSNMMSFSILMGVVLIWLFGKLAKRDSEGWDKSYESKGMKITRIVLMCIFGVYIVAPLLGLIFGWSTLRDNQKVSHVGSIMMGFALFYYELTLRPSPRGVWVKVRKVIAYILITFLYIGVWPTTIMQLTTGKIPGIYGNAYGMILIGNLVIYGFSCLVIWLLLRRYKRETIVPYAKVECPNDDTLPIQGIRPEDEDAHTLSEVIKDIPLGENVKDIRIHKHSLKKTDKVKNILRRLFSMEGKPLNKKKKWAFWALLFVLLSTGVFFLCKCVIVPQWKASKAAADIVKKFKTEDTDKRAEYAFIIVEISSDIYAFRCYPPSFLFDNNNKHVICRYGVKSADISSKLLPYRREAFKWLEEKAYQEDPKCQYLLGTLYVNLLRMPNYDMDNPFEFIGDSDKAAYWFLESAKNGYYEAYCAIGMCYEQGIGVKKNIDKAREWFQRGAEIGEKNAQYEYGECYLKMGYPELAKYWWRKSAVQGNETAKSYLQKIYE